MSGLFVLSLDTEIGWGTYTHAERRQRAEAFDHYREHLARLIALLDEYEVRSTWAIVGHLFLEPGESPPADLLRPRYAWSDSPQIVELPDPEHPDWYYARDTIEMIRHARVEHEIATHTYTHAIAADPAVTPEIWSSQLAACAKLHKANGLPFRSLVYPWNKVAYTEGLAGHGLATFRGRERSWYESLPGRWMRAGHLLHRALSLPAPTYAARDLLPANGVIDIPASQLLMPYDGIRRFIPTSLRVAQARRAMREAVRRDRLFHLWFHPFNLGSSPEMFVALERILEAVTEHRNRRGLRVVTMAEAAEWVLGSQR
jgi:peptidoglycan/xylan/chitin deacetylase (PgdA/CDA1 family)